MAIESFVLFLSGVLSLFTSIGIIFLIITSGLAILGIYKKMINWIYVSMALLVLVFIVNLNVIILFPVGAIQATLLTEGNLLDNSVYNFGLILIPLIVNLIGLLLVKR